MFGGRFGNLAAALMVAAFAGLQAAPAMAQSSACGDRVLVGFGDTLSSIARRCGVGLSDLMGANPWLPNAYFIIPGMSIRIPVVATPPSQGNVIRYTVRPGDTLSSIARAHNATLVDIYRLNPNIDARYLRIGDVVRLPGGIVPPPPPDQGNAIRYTVRPGDTLSSIARAHNVTLAEIYRLNPALDARYLRVGDVIRMPGRATPPPPAYEEIAFSPASGSPGSIVRVSASGFPSSASLRFLVGSSAYSLREIQRVSTDSRGRVEISARIPAWAAEIGRLVFAFETSDGRRRVVSDGFRVVAPAREVTVTGTLTREGAECQAMRGDDGRLYTLSERRFEGFRPGDRVRVQGRIAEVSFCQQGTTIDVTRIESAR